MKVHFDIIIRDLAGKPIMNPEGHSMEGKPMTLASAAVDSLSFMFPDEQNLDGNAKEKRWKLAKVAYAGGTADLKSEDITEIKKCLGKAYGPLVVGYAYHALEHPDEVLAEEEKKPPLQVVSNTS